MISELDINKLKIVDKIQKPYPLIIYSNLLDIENINSLQKSLSRMLCTAHPNKTK